MKITVIGTGYVGLVAGACFADMGWHVTCVDKDKQKIAMLEDGGIPIFEPGLEEIVHRAVKAENLNFTTNLDDAIAESETVFIGVGTPTEKGTDRADLTYVFAAVEEVVQAAKAPLLIVTKSTVPVGTAAGLRQQIAELNPDVAIDVASNPEFLREGSAVKDFLEPDRIVIGTETEEACATLTKLYGPLTSRGAVLQATDCVSAELIKYAANAFLATKIAFINEVADIAEKVGADISQIAKGMGLDHRISASFLSPGPGFGGSCFPKDTRALAAIARDVGVPSRIVEQVVESNTIRKASMVQKITQAAGGNLKGKRIGVLGLTFKANTDDMRESPSLVIVPALHHAGAEVVAYDPEGVEEAKPLLPAGIHYGSCAEDVITGSDILVILTEWDPFRTIGLEKIKQWMREPVLVDLRNLYHAEEARELGMDYYSVGRADVKGGRVPAKDTPYLSAVKSV
jgi:UDPglucose 6-dehydrogenase